MSPAANGATAAGSAAASSPRVAEAPVEYKITLSQPNTVIPSARATLAQTPAVEVARPQAGLAPKAGASVARTRPQAPRRLASRALSVQKMQERALLAQLDADLRRAERRLKTARQDLDEGARDLQGFTSTLQKAMFEAGPDAQGLHPFVRTAQRYAGTPYVWGGESRTGFDCSGFIIRVMRDLGYKALPHSAAEQFNYGTPIAQGLLKPGDLVFFKNTYKRGISHVGIYLGRGRFIHAAGTGKGPIVSYLAHSPFAEKYAGARRLVAVRS
jgi:cell wall-associated NlpC family hydrolase